MFQYLTPAFNTLCNNPFRDFKSVCGVLSPGGDVSTGRCPPWELVEAVTGLCKLCLINMHTEDSIAYYVEETSNIPYSKRAPSNHDIIQKQQTWYFSKTAPQPPWHFSKIHLATMASFNCTLATMSLFKNTS